MLVEFAVENFRSFKDMQRFQMEAANITSKNKDLDEQNVFKAKNLNLLKFKAIYGANGSGKSNIVKAMWAMYMIVRESFENEKVLEHIRPFYLDSITNQAPSFFQIVFIYENIQYRYGFEADRERIHSEWLFVKRRKEVPYFLREDDEIVDYNENSFSEIKAVLKNKHNNALFRKNSLVLSVLTLLNGKVTTLISSYILKTKFLSNRNEGLLKILYEKLDFLKNITFKKKTLDLLRGIDNSITNVHVNEKSETLIQRTYKQEGITKSVDFYLDEEEAEGTKKIFYLSLFIFETLKNGSTLMIDEFDARLHPLLSEKIVNLFNNKQTNPNNAQLIVVTHNTNLMDADLLRRDQILLVNKNQKGESNIVDLVDFKGIRNTASYEKDYLMGKYGALPYLYKIDQIFNH